MTLISPINRARLSRLFRTFHEVYAGTGSLPRAAAHSARFIGKKIIPLVRYAASTLTRLSVIRRLFRENAKLRDAYPVLGVRVLGGLGDYIVIARFLRDLSVAIEPAIFDIYSNKPRLAKWVFASLRGVRGNFDEALFSPASRVHTVAMQISQFVLIEDHWVAQGELRGFPRLRRVVGAIQAFRPSIAPIVAEHPRLDSFLAQKAIFANRSRSDYLHHMARLSYAGDHLDIATAADARSSYGLAHCRYVTVHNGCDPNMVVSHERATKCYPHFGNVIALLRARHPDLAFVQVGIQTSIRIIEADVNLLGRTTLPEVAELLRGAVLHIDNESGLVHLARAVGTSSCVVFGPTSSRYFGYRANINIDPPFCGACWWINETWMNHCPRGFPTARCMTEQPASTVAEAAERLLRSSSTLTLPADDFSTPACLPRARLSLPEAAT